MTDTKPMQPLCRTCQHPRSFHGGDGRCHAMGCRGCEQYVSPNLPRAEETPAEDAQ